MEHYALSAAFFQASIETFATAFLVLLRPCGHPGMFPFRPSWLIYSQNSLGAGLRARYISQGTGLLCRRRNHCLKVRCRLPPVSMSQRFLPGMQFLENTLLCWACCHSLYQLAKSSCSCGMARALLICCTVSAQAMFLGVKTANLPKTSALTNLCMCHAYVFQSPRTHNHVNTTC
jgi:hypothetical protein